MQLLKRGVLASIILFVAFSKPVSATELIKGCATAYCLSGTTASGEQTREGICASSGNRLNKTIILYKRLPDDSIGDLIGSYECKDTGATKGIKNGTVIDVWRPNYNSCKEFMNLIYEDGCKGKVYIQIIEGENLNE